MLFHPVVRTAAKESIFHHGTDVAITPSNTAGRARPFHRTTARPWSGLTEIILPLGSENNSRNKLTFSLTIDGRPQETGDTIMAEVLRCGKLSHCIPPSKCCSVMTVNKNINLPKHCLYFERFVSSCKRKTNQSSRLAESYTYGGTR